MHKDDYDEDEVYWDDYDDYHYHNSTPKENIKPNNLYLIF